MVERESLLENEWIDTSAAYLQILRQDESYNLKISKYFEQFDIFTVMLTL